MSDINLGQITLTQDLTKGTILSITATIVNTAPPAVPSVAKVSPILPTNIAVQPGKSIHIPVATAWDQYNAVRSVWTVSTSDIDVATAVKDDTGIIITGGTREGTCTLRVD